MDRWDDEHLEILFERMRKEERQFRPEFTNMWHDGPHALPRQRLRTIAVSIAPTAALVTTLILGLFVMPQESERVTGNARIDSIDFEVFSALVVEEFRNSSAVAWRSPTDYLLEPTTDRLVSVARWNYESVTN
jgi:hypothetical protein